MKMPRNDTPHPLVGKAQHSFAHHAEHPKTDAGCYLMASEHPGERAEVARSILLVEHPEYATKANPMTDADRYKEVVDHSPSELCEVAEAIIHTQHPEFKL
jgi:hypothetical protein